MKKLAVLLAVLVLACVAGCAVTGRPPRADETDRVAEIVSLAISFPRHDDAVGYARAANATRAAEGGELSVVGVSERHLVLAVHLEHYEETGFVLFGSRFVPEVTNCYEVSVHRYSGVGSPSRRPCPASLAPVRLPPPPRVREVPQGAESVVRAALRRTSSSADAVDEAVRRGLRAPSPGTRAPEVTVAANGPDLGVSVQGADACLLGSRVDGTVLVWRPSRVQVQPGELTCDPQTALARDGITPPH